MKPSYRRSRLWIDPPFQARLLGRMILYFMVYTFVIWHVSFALEAMRHIVSQGVTGSILDLYVEYCWKQLPLLYTFFLLVPALLYNLLRFSHRIAGPLFRCRKVMQEMAAGQPVREFTPRKNDLMGDLFAAFNGLIREWNARVAAPQPATSEAEVAANAVEPTAESCSDEAGVLCSPGTNGHAATVPCQSEE